MIIYRGIFLPSLLYLYSEHLRGYCLFMVYEANFYVNLVYLYLHLGVYDVVAIIFATVIHFNIYHFGSINIFHFESINIFATV